MSSAVLYLAIVAVWAIVLVPMWLRRDGETAGISRLLHKRPEEEEPEEPPAPRRVSRATIIARRRRRTAGLFALLLTAIGVAASGYAPWWTVTPPSVLLAGHLALLRVAVKMDAARAAAEARAAAARRAATATEPEPAEVIELITPDEVFDQYADDRRAVGE